MLCECEKCWVCGLNEPRVNGEGQFVVFDSDNEVAFVDIEFNVDEVRQWATVGCTEEQEAEGQVCKIDNDDE